MRIGRNDAISVFDIGKALLVVLVGMTPSLMDQTGRSLSSSMLIKACQCG